MSFTVFSSLLIHAANGIDTYCISRKKAAIAETTNKKQSLFCVGPTQLFSMRIKRTQLFAVCVATPLKVEIHRVRIVRFLSARKRIRLKLYTKSVWLHQYMAKHCMLQLYAKNADSKVLNYDVKKPKTF